MSTDLDPLWGPSSHSTFFLFSRGVTWMHHFFVGIQLNVLLFVNCFNVFVLKPDVCVHITTSLVDTADHYQKCSWSPPLTFCYRHNCSCLKSHLSLQMQIQSALYACTLACKSYLVWSLFSLPLIFLIAFINVIMIMITGIYVDNTLPITRILCGFTM